MGNQLPNDPIGSSGMRHRFHSICPYFAMFPESFAEKHLAASRRKGVVFDPFCGRGTAVFQALLQGREAAGCDINAVAACVSGAKCNPPTLAQVLKRIGELEEQQYRVPRPSWNKEIAEFFRMCFHKKTLAQLLYMREALNWRRRKADRFIAALCLGALHGESHNTPNCFSNRMPRTISTKPAYSVRWWKERNLVPPERDVFEILRTMAVYRYRTEPPETSGRIVNCDARHAKHRLKSLEGRVSDVITSPPYLDTTNYKEDQWLRLWFLGGSSSIDYHRGDNRYCDKDLYWRFLTESWNGIAPLLADKARVVVRIGGRRLLKEEAHEGLRESLRTGLGKRLRSVDAGITSEIEKTQANVFRGGVEKASEHDFCFVIG